MWCKCFQSRLYELQNRERISLAAASKLLSNMAMLMPLFNTLIVVMIFKTWVSPWVWWSLGMTRRDPGSVMLTGVNIVQLDDMDTFTLDSCSPRRWPRTMLRVVRRRKWNILHFCALFPGICYLSPTNQKKGYYWTNKVIFSGWYLKILGWYCLHQPGHAWSKCP